MDKTRNYSLVVISDTHCLHDRLHIPTCDFLIHCGDFSHLGRPQEVNDFFEWFVNQTQASHRICIPGNHEITLDPGHDGYNEGVREIVRSYENDCHYLVNRHITLDGLKIFGSPVSRKCGNWGWGLSETDMAKTLDLYMPQSIDIVVTHGPGYMMQDWVPHRGGEHTGSHVLLDRVTQSEAILHLCGHIHPGRGFRQNNHILHANASCIDDYYKVMPDTMMIEIEEGNVSNYGFK